MSSRTVHIARSCALLALICVAVPPASAQETEPLNVDSLTSALDTPDVNDRAMAVSALSTLPLASLPSATRGKLIALLDREAATPSVENRPDDGEDGAVGPYLNGLVRAVVKLQDPSSARGLALVGLSMSAKVQIFIASLGETSVALLDEVERVKPADAQVIAETRGRMLGDYSPLLSTASRNALRAKILKVATTDVLAFAWAARFAHLVEATPLLTQLAASATDDLSRSVLTRAAGNLATQRTQASTEAIIQSLSASISALCLHAQTARLQVCQSMVTTLTAAFNSLRTSNPTQAHNLLLALAKAADTATRNRSITTNEGAMISGTATYLATRI